ncbi:MAG: tetratricopeptide repeat protein [bacterium]
MNSNQQKCFSVTINLNKFDAIDGKLTNFTSDVEREAFITNFFRQRYGDGSGKLEIEQNKLEVKLKWLSLKVDSRAEFLHKEALSQARHKNYNEAINKWVKAISVNSNDPDYYFNLGIAFYELKNYKESIENLKKSINLCPIYYKAYLILGTVYLKIRKYLDSEEFLKESIRFYPNHALTYLNLGAVYSILKRYDEGIKMFQKTLELSPKEIRAHFGLGKIYSLKGEVEKANQYFKNVIEYDTKGQLANHAKRAMILTPLEGKVQITTNRDVKNVEKFYQEGYRAFLFTDYDKAIMLYKSYLKNKPNDDFVWFSLGEAYLRAGNILEAVEAFQAAININQSKPLYYKELALAFNFQEKDNDVIECLKKAKELGKNDSITNTLWGKILIKQQNFSDAILHLEQALKNNSNNLFAKYHLAVALMRNGELELAKNHLQEILRTPLNSPLKMEAKSILQKIKD